MNQHLIIVAGGTGTRMNSDMPKQFLDIKGKPVIIRTIERFLAFNPRLSMVLVIHPDFETHLQTLLETFLPQVVNIRLTQGGSSRFESVKNGLRLLQGESGVVGIHDAARPFVSVKTITNCYQTAAKLGNATPCVAIHESLRQVNESGSSVVNRDKYKTIQTPQCFDLSLIQQAFGQAYSPSFTDDATVFETTGHKINLVEGNIENIKITGPSDLIIAKAFCDHE